MKPIVDVLSTILQGICVVLFSLLVLIVVWQVVARQILNNPQAWTEEASRMVFVWVGLFAAALVFSERGHVAVDFLVRRFPPAGQKIFGIAVQLLIIFFAGSLMVYGGIRASVGASNQRLAALDFLTLGQMYYVLPVSGVLIIIFALANVITIATGAEPAFGATDEEQLLEELEAEGVLPAAEGEGATRVESSTAEPDLISTSNVAETVITDPDVVTPDTAVTRDGQTVDDGSTQGVLDTDEPTTKEA